MATSEESSMIPPARGDGPSAPGGPPGAAPVDGPANPDALTVAQLARMLAVPEETVLRHVAAGAPATAAKALHPGRLSKEMVGAFMEETVTTNGLDPDKMTAAQRLDELAGQAQGFTVMLDVDDIGAILKCSLRTVYRLIDSGRMPPPVRLGGLIRWSPAVIEEWLAKGCQSCRKQLPR